MASGLKDSVERGSEGNIFEVPAVKSLFGTVRDIGGCGVYNEMIPFGYGVSQRLLTHNVLQELRRKQDQQHRDKRRTERPIKHVSRNLRILPTAVKLTLSAAHDGAEGTSTARLISPPHLMACFSTDGSLLAEHWVTRATGHLWEGNSYQVMGIG